MEPLVLGQWYRATVKDGKYSYIFIYHGRSWGGLWLVEQITGRAQSLASVWNASAVTHYNWEEVPVGTLK